jgi:hypothetical protein
MRAHLLLLAPLALGAAACQSNTMHLEYRSTLWNETRGVVLYAGEVDRGHGAMLDTTCEFDLVSGAVTGDLDLPTSSEVVSDVMRNTVLARSAEGVHVIRDLFWEQDEDLITAGVIDAAFGQVGPLALTRVAGDCAVVDHSGPARALGACSSEAQLLTEPVSDRAWLLDQGVISEITDVGLVEVAVADHATVDLTTDTLLVASGTRLERRTLDGLRVWSLPLPARVTSLEDLGEFNGAAVVTADQELVLVDGMGQEAAVLRLPEPAHVTASANGRNLALATGEQVNFYQVQDGPPGVGRASDAPVENDFED